MNCEPCKDTECLGLEEQEYEALKALYQRIVDSRGCCPDDDDGENDDRERCPSRGSAHGDATDQDQANWVDECSNESSRLKVFDRNLTALLKQREGKTTEHGMAQKNLSKLPTFKSCKAKPGTVNAALFALDIEQQINSGRADIQGSVKRAAYDLAMAEAYCKHSGAVEAAELAAQYEPMDYLAEDAARIGAQTFSSVANVGQMGDTDNTDSPVEVVAYVGNTYPPKDSETES